jgi:hypothetical protein
MPGSYPPVTCQSRQAAPGPALVAVPPNFQNVAFLGLIVLVRAFLSFSLEVEIDGVGRGGVPWRFGQACRPHRPRRASQKTRELPGRPIALGHHNSN